jgi:hypothetical protein
MEQVRTILAQFGVPGDQPGMVGAQVFHNGFRQPEVRDDIATVAIVLELRVSKHGWGTDHCAS